MLEYNRFDVSEGVDDNKTDGPHYCFIYYYCTFLK